MVNFNKVLTSYLCSFFLTLVADASQVSVAAIDHKLKNGSYNLVISFKDKYIEVPKYNKRPQSIDLILPKSYLDPNVSVNFDGKIKKEGTGLILTFHLEEKLHSQLQVSASSNELRYIYPKKKLNPQKDKVNDQGQPKEYLSYLIDSVSQKSSASDSLIADEIKFNSDQSHQDKQDPVEKKQFELPTYVMKSVLVLFGIIAFFLAIAQVFRKFVSSRSKLNFLKGDRVIEVIANSYISPKRNLQLIRVHEQIILVANTETGITMLTEVQDSTGLLKQGEKLLSGTNFDKEIGDSENDKLLNQKVKLKDLDRLDESSNPSKLTSLMQKMSRKKERVI